MEPPVAFVKMSGAGNDFLVFGPRGASSVEKNAAGWIPRLCRRRISIGADGVLFVEPAGAGRVRVRFFNPDGSPAFCGNGSRCAARFALLRGLADASMTLETVIGDVPALVEGERVRLTLPSPRLIGDERLAVGDETLTGRRVLAGVPHFVVGCDDLASAPLERWGPHARRHRVFGEEGTNLDLVEKTKGDRLGLRTWERGVEGETLACGSGAVAAAFTRRLDGGARTITVVPASGIPLVVSFPGPRENPESAMLSGDARVVFRGELGADALT